MWLDDSNGLNRVVREDGLAQIGTKHVSINSTAKKTEVYAYIFMYVCSVPM